jgi:hypothetical protein
MAENFAAQSGEADGEYGLRQGMAPGVLVEYRLEARYRRPFLARFVLTGSLTGLAVAALAMSPHLDYALIASLLGIGALYNGIAYAWRGRFRTRVTRDGIEVRGYFNHFVPWSEVKAVLEEGYGESGPMVDGYYDRQYGAIGRRSSRPGGTTGRRARLGVVRIVRRHGKGVMLRAPLVTAWAPDPYFSDKLRQMQALSSQYGTRPISS